ncbi:MAG: hypothetical protein AAF462_03650 [Thermodesulfobacteriota bacterium]
MNRLIMCLALVLFLLVGVASSQATDLTTAEFRQMYDSLLAGKTLATQVESNGTVIKSEWQYGQAIDLAEGDFDIPVKRVITKMENGQMVQKKTLDILDRVNNLGDSAVIYEESRTLTVENAGDQPLSTTDSEFLGQFITSKNDKGGFDVYNFGLIPSVVVEDGANKMAASNISYSCYAENGKSKCVLTIRDFSLGDYNPLTGFELGEPVGTDHVIVAEEQVAP